MIGTRVEAIEWLRQTGLADELALDRLTIFGQLLVNENQRQNLISRNSTDSIWVRHIADSAQLVAHVSREISRPWLDLGTGAGFPGIVAAILLPQMPIVLVESRRRRIEWLTFIASHLELDRVAIAGQRLEDLASFKADVISARAFAPVGRLLDGAMRFSDEQTRWLLPRGRSAVSDLVALEAFDHSFHVEPSLTDDEAGILIGELMATRKAVT